VLRSTRKRKGRKEKKRGEPCSARGGGGKRGKKERKKRRALLYLDPSLFGFPIEATGEEKRNSERRERKREGDQMRWLLEHMIYTGSSVSALLRKRRGKKKELARRKGGKEGNNDISPRCPRYATRFPSCRLARQLSPTWLVQGKGKGEKRREKKKRVSARGGKKERAKQPERLKRRHLTPAHIIMFVCKPSHQIVFPRSRGHQKGKEKERGKKKGKCNRERGGGKSGRKNASRNPGSFEFR